MAIVKKKGYRVVQTNPARAITSVIVPLREKNRDPQIALQEFANRTITLYLFAGIYCTISELQKTMHHIVKIWRRILNNDIRYQQKMDNLPSFLGVRDTCVRFSSPDLLGVNDTDPDSKELDEKVYPYLRITIDNLQVATFILMKWCYHIGLRPHQVSWICKKKRQTDANFIDFFKCTPLFVEHLMNFNNDIRVVQFGEAGYITREFVDRNHELYNIPTIRVSQKFGTSLSVYSTRKLQRLRDEQLAGTLERIRRGDRSKAIHRMEWNRLDAKRRYACVTDSNVAPWYYREKWMQSYDRQRDKVVLRCTKYDAQKTDEELAKVNAPQLVEKLPDAGDILNTIQTLKKIAQNANEKRKRAEQEYTELVERLEAGGLRTNESITLDFETHRKARNYITQEFSIAHIERDKEESNINFDALDSAIKLLRTYYDVEVDKSHNTIKLK